jgi:hypothetical protein
MSDDARLKILRRKYQEKALEHAFDNELDEVKEAFDDAKAAKAPLPIDPVPPKQGSKAEKEDSVLGEAACGDAVDVVKWCLEHGAKVNYVGKFNRTPLHRAINNDAMNAAALLLEAGADPRLLLPQEREEPSDEFPSGRILFRDWDPAEVDGLQCSKETKAVLKAWDIKKTFALLDVADAGRAQQAAAETAEQQKTAQQSASKLDDLKAKYDGAVAALKAAIERREARILEYDTLKCEGKSEDQLAPVLDLVKTSEDAAKECEFTVKRLEPAYRAARKEAHIAAAVARGDDPDAKYDLKVGLSQLEDIVSGEPGSLVAGGDAEAGSPSCKKQCVLLIDRTGNALTFLTYRAVGISDLGNSHHMSPTQLRLGVIGGLRYGKPMVINMRNKELSEAFITCKARFDAAVPGMFAALIKDRARDPAVYKEWITEDVVAAHPEFEPRRFVASDTQRFRFLLLTHEECPQDWEVLGQFVSVLVE